MSASDKPVCDVLIVDDKRDRRAQWIGAVARVSGSTPRTAASYEEALHAIREANVDLFIADMFLTKESSDTEKPDQAEGLGLIEECRGLHPNSRIIAITGHGGVATEIGARALSKGADDFIADWRHVRSEALLEQKVRIFLAVLDDAAKAPHEMSKPQRSSSLKDSRLSILRPPTEETPHASAGASRSEADRQRFAELECDVEDLVEGFGRVQAKLLRELSHLKAERDTALRLLQEHGLELESRPSPIPAPTDDFPEKARTILAHPEGISAEDWERYHGQWVALDETGTKVVAADPTYDGLESRLAEIRVDPQEVWFMQIPHEDWAADEAPAR